MTDGQKRLFGCNIYVSAVVAGKSQRLCPGVRKAGREGGKAGREREGGADGEEGRTKGSLFCVGRKEG